MELNTQIKKYRTDMNLSQEELADKIFVTRQTISNWENNKNYPDIHSLLLMSSLFGVTLDQLIKGDLDKMRQEIQMKEIQKMNRDSWIFSCLLILTIISIAPLFYFFGTYGLLGITMLFLVTLFYAGRVEKLKKENDIQTYQEILAFMNGKHLDEITKQREVGKRPYQKFLLAAGCGVITFLVCMALMQLLTMLNG